jgi:hypothetical protein
LRWTHSAGELRQVFKGGNAKVTSSFEQFMQHFYRGSSIIKRSMCWLHRYFKVCSQCSKFAVSDFIALERYASQPGGIYDPMGGPGQVEAGAGAFQKTYVVARVMGDEHRTMRKLQE